MRAFAFTLFPLAASFAAARRYRVQSASFGDYREALARYLSTYGELFVQQELRWARCFDNPAGTAQLAELPLNGIPLMGTTGLQLHVRRDLGLHPLRGWGITVGFAAGVVKSSWRR